MATKRLVINQGEVEMYDSAPIALTYQVNNIAELKDRQANYSNTFQVPATHNNIRYLCFTNEVASINAAMYRRLPATYTEDEQILIDGFAIIESSNYQEEGGFFTISLFSGIYEFFEVIIGEATLKNYDWSNYDTELSLTNVFALNAANGEITFPLINFGAYNKLNPVDIRYQYPCLKLSAVVDTIMEKSGYTLEGAVLEEARYLNAALVLDFNQDIADAVKLRNSARLIARQNFLLSVLGYDPRTGVGITIPGYQIVNGNIFYNSGGPRGERGEREGSGRGGKWFNLLNMIQYTTDLGGNTHDGSFIGDSFIITNSSVGFTSFTKPIKVYKASIEHTVQITGAVIYTAYDQYADENPEELQDVSFEWGIILNGNRINTNNLDYGVGISFTMSVDQKISLQPGDEITIIVSTNIEGTLFAQDGAGVFSYLEFESINASTVGEDISINTLIPEISAKEILKSIANLFACIFSVDGNTVTLTMFNELQENVPEDWSSKLDLKRGYENKPRIGTYTRVNWAKYADDNTKGIGNGQLLIDDGVLNINSDLFTLVFSGSEPYYDIIDASDEPAGGNTGVTIPILTLFDTDAYNPYETYAQGEIVQFGGQVWQSKVSTTGNDPQAGTFWELYAFQYEQTQEVNTRIVLIRPISYYDSSTIEYTDGVTTTTVAKNENIMAYFVDGQQNEVNASPALNGFGDLDMNTILNDYYGALRSILFRCKSVTCYMNLTKKDIRTLDFLTPKHVQFFGNNFYLNTVSYVEGQSSQVNLIRM